MNYLKDIVCAALLCGIVTSISSLTSNGSGKYVRYVCALFFLCVILSPFIKDTADSMEYLNDLYDISFSETEEYKAESRNKLDIISDEICRAVVNNTAEAFNVSSDCFAVKLYLEEYNDGSITIKKSDVTVSGAAEKTPLEKLKLHFEKILNCKVEIVYA